jgi:hypothetical protein
MWVGAGRRWLLAAIMREVTARGVRPWQGPPGVPPPHQPYPPAAPPWSHPPGEWPAGAERAVDAPSPAPPPTGWPATGLSPWGSGRVGWVRGAALSGLRVAAPAAERRFQQAVTAWRDPGRRFERSKRRARRWLVLLSLLTAALAVATWQVSDGGWAVPVGLATVLVGLKAVEAGRRVWRLEHTAAPPPSAAPLPRGSAAWPAMQRLAERERVLADLLSHLGPSADDTRCVAADAVAALRTHAARVSAVDRARRGAVPAARAGLDAALAVLVQQLDDGVAGYDALVVAAADAVSAAATFQAGDPVLASRLADATDTLAGLAAGLREVTSAG